MTIFLSLLLAGCSNADHSKKTKGIQLNAQFVRGLKQGKIIGTPLSLDDGFSLNAVKTVWGKPVQHIDREDIQSYVYKKDGQIFQIDDHIETDAFKDQRQYKYSFVVHLKVTRSKIIQEMRMSPKIDGKRLISYQYNGHVIQFEKNGRGNRWLMFFRNASQSDSGG